MFWKLFKLIFFLGFAKDFMVERVQQRPDQVREPSLCQEQRSQSSQHGKLDRSSQIYFFKIRLQWGSE